MKSNSKGTKKEEIEKAKSQGISKGRDRKGEQKKSKANKSPKTRNDDTADIAEKVEGEEEEGTGAASEE